MYEFMTFKSVCDQVSRQIGDTSDRTLTKIQDWINIHYAQIARDKMWPQLLRSSEQETTLTAGAAHLYLPKEMEQIYFVMPQNVEAAVNMALDALLRGAGTQFQTAGPVVQWAEAGEFGRRRDFYTSAETLTITQTGGSSLTAVVQGVVTSKAPVIDSQERTEEVTVAPGGTATSLTYADVHAVSVEELTSNVVTVTGTTSGYIYATIGAGEQTARYKRIRLMQPSVLADAYTIVWKKRVAKLVFDHQAIEIPVGPQLVDAVVATMLVRQREYNSAAIYHQQRAQSGVEAAFAASQAQGEKVMQAVPYGRDRYRRMIVVNPT